MSLHSLHSGCGPPSHDDDDDDSHLYAFQVFVNAGPVWSTRSSNRADDIREA